MATIDLSVILSPQDQARVVATYQSGANTDVNGTATPAQVLAFIKKIIRAEISANVVAFELAAAQLAVAAPIPPIIN